MKKKIGCVFLLMMQCFTMNWAFAENKIDQQDFETALFKDSTIHSIQTLIKNRKITCEQLIKAYLTRIKKYNLSISKQAPINAFTEINTNVLEQARQLDASPTFGPLHCIPVLLKDNIDSYDSTTTSGTLALLGNQPNQDAFLVTQLRNAGAVILGKAGMDELASGIYGISSRSGRVGNAYHHDKNPGGSSSGSAAAVSANFAMLGIGTDNSGSVRIPAAFNGIYGLRPSTGLISQRGIFPAGNLDGTAGPLARTVEDLVLLLDVIAKEDPLDKKTTIASRPTTYRSYLNQNGLKGKRIGIIRRVSQADTFKAMPDEITKIFNAAVELMKQSGAVIVEDIQLTKFNSHRKFNMAGMRQDVDDYLASYPAARKNFRDICQSDRTRVFGNIKACLKFIESLPAKSNPAYDQVLAIFHKNKTYVETLMNEEHLDALLVPISTMGSATYDAHKINTWSSPIASNAGLPAITINLGYTSKDEMPVGFELIGKKFAEGTLIEMTYAYEKASVPRKIPEMPDENLTLEKLDIPGYNNLLTRIGYKSYQEVLKAGHSDLISNDLTAGLFKSIVSSELRSMTNR